MKHEPMTQERLEAIRARLADVGAIWKYAATPTGDGEVITVGQEGPIAWGIDIDSAALIAHAPQDLADLLAEVKRLRALTTVDDAKIERVARNLANLEPGEAWPTTRELGGVPRSGRDEEYRSAMREWAQKVINMSLGEDEDEWI